MKQLFRLAAIFFILPLSFLLGESFESSTLYLTWEHDPCTTMTIQWLSENPETARSTVYFRDENNGKWRFSDGVSFPFPHSNYYLHKVELTGLKPNSLYSFKIASDESSYLLKTMPSDTDSGIKFVVGGDMFHDDISFMNNTSKQAAKVDPDFAVIGGDIAYVYLKGRQPRFQRWIAWIQSWHANMVTSKGVLIPVIAAIGNHDLSGGFDQAPAVASDFAVLFPMPGNRVYNVLDFEGYMSLFLLDSGHANSINGAQKEWLGRSLSERSLIRNKFAFYHVPAYPAVRSFQDKRSKAIRQNWVPLFEKAGVSIAFEHHDHAYKRTYPILKNRVQAGGVVFMGDGGWGVEKLRTLKRSKKPFYLAKFLSLRHFIVVSLQNDELRVETIDDNGNKIDELDFKGKDEL